MVAAALWGFVAAWLGCLAIIRWRHWHSHLSADSTQGVQKFHVGLVPRIGGLAVYLGLWTGAYVMQMRALGEARASAAALDLIWLCAAALPAFAAGLAEDLTKRQPPALRLALTMVSAVLAWWWLDAAVVRLDIAPVDDGLEQAAAAFVLTLVAVAGVTHAFNIIDGFHGLASMVGAMILAAIAYVAYKVQDPLVMGMAFLGMAATGGFWFWNWPRGLIFLGDGGAYLIGFWVAEAAVLLVARNPEVSAWFALMVLAYPVTETLFSALRRYRRGVSPLRPDGIHLHTLIYRRLVCWTTAGDINPGRTSWRNALTAPYLWGLTLFSLAPAVLGWRSTPFLMIASAAFAGLYLGLYWGIVRFRLQRWLALRRR